MIDLVPPFDERAVSVVKKDRAAEGAAPRIVLYRKLPLKRSGRPIVGHGTIEQVRLRIMSAKVRPPLELPLGRLLSLQNDVGDLSRETGYAEAGRIHDFDPVHVRRWRAPEFIDRAARLVGNPLAVDQDVFGLLAESALQLAGRGRPDREPRDLDEHVVGRPRSEARKVGGRINAAIRVGG